MNDEIEKYLSLESDPISKIEESRKFKKTIESLISMVERELTERERHDYVSRYGLGAFVIGDYVIRRRP